MVKNNIFFSALAVCAAFASSAAAADLKVTFARSEAGSMLPAANASCMVTPEAKDAPAKNLSPGLSWSKGPKGTRSYALTMVDQDVPADLTNFNKQGTTYPKDAPRMEFVHWILADIPAGKTELAEGADSKGLPKGGLKLERTDHGRRGQSGFAAFMKDGPYGGYRGACPPWNDERPHRYRLTVYALDTDRLDLPEAFTRADLLAAAKGHILAEGAAELTYSTNAKAGK